MVTQEHREKHTQQQLCKLHFLLQNRLGAAAVWTYSDCLLVLNGTHKPGSQEVPSQAGGATPALALFTPLTCPAFGAGTQPGVLFSQGPCCFFYQVRACCSKDFSCCISFWSLRDLYSDNVRVKLASTGIRVAADKLTSLPEKLPTQAGALITEHETGNREPKS